MANSFLAETLIGNDTRVVADGKKPRGRRRFMSEVQAAVLNCANEIRQHHQEWAACSEEEKNARKDAVRRTWIKSRRAKGITSMQGIGRLMPYPSVNSVCKKYGITRKQLWHYFENLESICSSPEAFDTLPKRRIGTDLRSTYGVVREDSIPVMQPVKGRNKYQSKINKTIAVDTTNRINQATEIVDKISKQLQREGVNSPAVYNIFLFS